jgi:hypothetical protein
MGSEELLITRIENDLRGLKLRTKKFETVCIQDKLIRLRKTNPYMADELEKRYIILYARHKEREEIKEKKLNKVW